MSWPPAHSTHACTHTHAHTPRGFYNNQKENIPRTEITVLSLKVFAGIVMSTAGPKYHLQKYNMAGVTPAL